jgi:hypothetical protein
MKDVKVARAYFTVLSQNMPEKDQENHEKPLSTITLHAQN